MISSFSKILILPFLYNNMNEFDALVEEVFYSFMDFRPDYATALGLHEYDKKMPSATKEAQETHIQFLKEYIEKFSDIPEENLTPEEKIDRKLIMSILKQYLFLGDDVRWWEKDPDFTDMVGIFPLFFREFAPFEERLESITARLSQCPQLITEHKTRIQTTFTLWVDMTKEACHNLPFLFETISTASKQKGLDTSEFDDAAARTIDAISEYTQWLDTLHCEGSPFLGRDMYETLLRVRAIPLTADEILKIGEHYLEREEKKLRELAASIDPSASVQEVRTTIRNEHPSTFEDALKKYQKAVSHAREAVIRKGFATIPENERLIVMETPRFLRHILPLAAYSPPARFEPDQKGMYLVTPAEGDLLREHNYTAIVNVSFHEGYPGHHLQALWANKNPSLVRALSFSGEYREGWAHYCEERMRDYGFSDPPLQFMQTIFIIFRAVRIITDVKLHCGEMTFDEAVSLYESKTGMDHSIALNEVKWCTKSPTGSLSYLIGKHLLLQLQKDVQTHLKEKYSDRQFHDAVLQAGSMPFPYLREELKLKGML